jgi:hypothetical protein
MTPQINHPKINTTKNLTAAPFEKRNTRQHNGEKMNDPMTPNDQLHNLIFPSLKKFSHMKNFFEFFGFLSMAGISAALIFLFIGKKEGLKGGGARGGFLTEMSATAEVPDAPRAIADRPARSEKREKSARSVAAPSVREIAPEEQLKSLYNDDAFVAATAKKWKSAVADAADEYNIKPQVLLAHVLVQSYLGGYSKSDFNDDVARHAGERVKPVSAALKGYRYGWSMQKLMAGHDLLRYFPEEMPTAVAAAEPVRFVPEKKMTAKGGSAPAKPAAPVAKNSPAEEGFRAMVAKEYGFSSWSGLQRLADPDTKADAQKRVKTLMMAARVR